MKADDRYDSLFKYYAEKKDLDWLLLKAQARAESRFKPDAVSPVGAVGLTQFMRATWLEWRDGTPGIQPMKTLLRRDNPEHAIRAQAAYLKWLFQKFRFMSKEKQQTAVFAAYNWGIGRVKRLIKKYGWFDLDFTPLETQRYVYRIETFLTIYKRTGQSYAG